MNRAERIRLIQEAGDSLAQRPKAQIQLILSEHDAQTYDYEVGFDGGESVYDYCLSRVQALGNDTLVSLHDFLLGTDAPSTEAIDGAGGPWSARLPLKVFISHLSAEKVWVSEVKRALAAGGIDAFVAHEDIHPSREWRDVIKLALRSCDAIVVMLHDHFHESEWCDQEVGWGLARGVPVVPVNLTTVPVQHGFLADIQHVFAQGLAPTLVAERIVAGLEASPRLSDKLDECAVINFCGSRSFARTRALWPRLSAVRSLSEDQVSQLREALRENDQLFNATAMNKPVTDLVEELLARLRPDLPAPNPYF